MVRLYFSVFLLCVLSVSAFSQERDSLTVIPTVDGWTVHHRVQKGETIFMLARRYHVPPAILAEVNGLTYQDGLKDRATVIVPVGSYNLQTVAPKAESRPLYYRVKGDDNLYRVARQAQVPQKTLQSWNNLPEPTVTAGKTLLVGWLLIDASQAVSTTTNNVVTTPAVIPATKPAQNAIKPVQNTTVIPKSAPPPSPVTIVQQPTAIIDTVQNVDTLVAKPAEGLEQQYIDQTAEGANVVTETGTAAFFPSSGKGPLYAFHNMAPRGSIIKVHNPGTDQTVYVKVLGPLPGTKQYANAIIGISGAARAALGVKDSRAWCELSYAGY